MSYQIMIVDDEPLVRERVRDLLKGYTQFTVCNESVDGEAAIQAIRQHQPDVLFIDIKMPKLNGFAVLDAIEISSTLVIFITAYDSFAVKAFDYAAFDYLVKPITIERFAKTMNRVNHALSQKHQGQTVDTITIRSSGVLYKLPISAITHLEAANNYVKVHTPEHCYPTRSTLTKLINCLSNFGFVRVHRSYAINSRSITSMTHVYKGEYLIKLVSGRVIPTSKAYSEAVKVLLNPNSF